MRAQFAEFLLEEMKRNEKIIVITADVGFGVLDKVRTHFPDRFLNVGASEQLLIGAAVGYAYEGWLPIAYTISSFLINRPFEFLRNYLNHECPFVKLVGSGRDRDYAHDGVTHWAHDQDAIMAALSNIAYHKPPSQEFTAAMFRAFLSEPGPGYLNLSRF